MVTTIAPPLVGGVLNRFDDVVVAGATAEVALEAEANRFLVGVGLVLQQANGRHDHAGGAVAALQAVLLPEAFLDRVQLAVLLEPFDRDDVGALGLEGEDRAGLDGAAVHEHGAGAALSGVAADVGAGEVQVLTQEVDEEQPWLHVQGVAGPVDRQ